MRQISVFLNNEKGRLEKITGLLAEKQIDIKSLCIAETEKFGILRMIVNNVDEAVAVLHANDVVCDIANVLAVEVDDIPGGLNKVLTVFSGLNIEYMYDFLERTDKRAVMIFKFSELDKAEKIAEENGMVLFSEENLLNKV
ncbi:MAG: amino acid-binding protein [Spirochaetales bacterium]|nr:amino acid-binding protein [Spirochaetales bacterium]